MESAELESLVKYDYDVIDAEETISKAISMLEGGKKGAILVKEGDRHCSAVYRS